jgi:mono/diheme cytochrome c family protein
MDKKIRLSPVMRTLVVVGLSVLAVCIWTSGLFGQNGAKLRMDTGEEIFKNAGCIACHGSDGAGTPQTTAGFERSHNFPDFTSCSGTTPEPNSTWKAVITHGGPTRGFSPIMPSFSEVLTSEQIDKVILYLRDFCKEKWPRGELNLPRAIATEKAFPEDEEVIATSVNAQGAPGVFGHVIHEQRFGVNNQIEVDVPLTFQNENHVWYGGVGDTTLGVKRVMFSNLRGSILSPSGSILALFGGVVVPSGSRKRGFGSGTTTFETFAAFDQLFPTNTFVQLQLGASLPRHTDIAPQNIFFNSAVGQSIVADHGLGRVWSPMMEFLASRDLVDHAKTNWDVVPQMQVTISKRQHIKADLGVRVPVTNTANRSTQVVFYILWDWFDGHLNEGW